MKKNQTLLKSHVLVYRFIETYIKKHGYAPENKEIAAGIKPPVTMRHVVRLVDDLVALKYLSKGFHQHRGITIKRPLETVAIQK